MSWGIKITILYLGFVAIIMTLVITCYLHKSELEVADYYAKELKFQDQIDATENANGLSKPIAYLIRDRSVQLILPAELLSADMHGTAYFMRPSDASRDKTIQLNPGPDGIQTIDPGFLAGAYKMQISVISHDKKYFMEVILTFK